MKCLRAATYCESGVHVGLFSSRKVSLVTCCGFLPSRSMIQMLSPPERSEVNAIHLPSGEYRGCMSQGMPEVRGFASPPPAGIT